MRNSLTKIVFTAGMLAMTAAAPTPAPKGKTGFEVEFPTASLLAKSVGRMSDAALVSAAAGNYDAAKKQAEGAIVVAACFGTAWDTDAFREAAFIRRLVNQLDQVPEETRGDLLNFLLEHRALAHTMAFAVDPKDQIPGAYALLDRLRKERPKQLERLPELAVALCVVRDKPLVRNVNENRVTAADPIDVFDFYVAHENQMFYGLRGVPVDLLCRIVDTTCSVDELNWALNKYGGTRDVGALFGTIKYDTKYYEGKAEKKVDSAPGGYNLPNVLKYGGVCSDQAYFATSVGKAIGIPTAIAGAASALAGHAWVGYLKSSGKSAAWDFNSGRFGDYQGLRGDVLDPQTDEVAADSTVGLLGDMIGTTAIQRQNVAALTDAAAALGAHDPADVVPFPEDAVRHSTTFVPRKPPVARTPSAEGQLDVIEFGLQQFASYPRAWAAVADLAKDGKLSEYQKKKWAYLTQRMCGKNHPDFAMSLLCPMVESVTDIKEQSALWESVFKLVQTRVDLAAEIRFREANMWEKQNDLAQAGMCYTDVVQRDINAGPFAVKALYGAESILKKMGHPDRVLDLYAWAVKMVTKPSLSGRIEFASQSNWYKVREAYANHLSDAGQLQLADRIRSEDKITPSAL